MGASWLVKQEPSSYPFATFVKEGRTAWTGVRNSTARIHLRAMKKGDAVLYYHSGDEKAVVGLARVVREAYPDPTDAPGGWVAVDLEAVEPLAKPVTLSAIKADPALADFLLVRNSRLSVMPVTPAHWKRLTSLSRTT